jgi:DNA modification methylase
MVCTSPPYFGLRDYGTKGQIGLEPTPDAYVAALVGVFREVRRALVEDGTLWLNLGDCYATGAGKGGRLPWRRRAGGVPTFQSNRMPLPGLKPKDLIGIPWRVAFALQADGWYLRSDIIWHKPNPMPESVTDRPTKAHEYLFLLSKGQSYYYDADAIAEAATGVKTGGFSTAVDAARKAVTSGGKPADVRGMSWETRNRRSVWTVPTSPYPGAHFATFPEALVEPCVLAGSRPGDLVLDPFAGTCTVGRVAAKHGRRFVGVDLNPKYLRDLAPARLRHVQLALREAAV